MYLGCRHIPSRKKKKKKKNKNKNKMIAQLKRFHNMSSGDVEARLRKQERRLPQPLRLPAMSPASGLPAEFSGGIEEKSTRRLGGGVEGVSEVRRYGGTREKGLAQRRAGIPANDLVRPHSPGISGSPQAGWPICRHPQGNLWATGHFMGKKSLEPPSSSLLETAPHVSLGDQRLQMRHHLLRILLLQQLWARAPAAQHLTPSTGGRWCTCCRSDAMNEAGTTGLGLCAPREGAEGDLVVAPSGCSPDKEKLHLVTNEALSTAPFQGFSPLASLCCWPKVPREERLDSPRTPQPQRPRECEALTSAPQPSPLSGSAPAGTCGN
ncbi:hypothetical protein QTO34_009813 [Cnephaeus nilssonii]|uniref:Uncharacterized protein n=1 Tax=Cnephaeus nilssonii TaxID=3371016 RepID=A0AA40HFC0_CNENI|nr:hypothetical protein QTO34_009813 [Eptesicus nilssonii]